jgi:hypothetical protein
MLIESIKNLKIAKEKQKKINIWENSLFDGIQNLTIDQVGFVGEMSFFEMVFKCDNLISDYNPSNTDQPDGIYEGTIGKKGDEKIKVIITNPKFKNTSKRNLFRYSNRVETKTARLGVSNSFQHEKIKDSSYTDFIIFVDYAPNSIYLTILKASEMDFSCEHKHPILGRKIHHRKKEDSYKFDISLKGAKNGIKKGITLEINEDTDENEIKNFIEKFFIDPSLM